MNDPTGKKMLTMIHCALIPSILAVLGVCAIVLPKPTVSEYERRDLEVFPEFTLASLRSGEYTNQIERFYADTFPMREMFVQMSADLAEKRGIQYNEMTLYDTGTEPLAMVRLPLLQEMGGILQAAPALLLPVQRLLSSRTTATKTHRDNSLLPLSPLCRLWKQKGATEWMQMLLPLKRITLF